MSSVNLVILVGNLVADPEVRATGVGTTVTNFRMATNEKWQSENGIQERTEYHNIVAWAKLGELCGNFLGKGSKVYVQGSLHTRKWANKVGKIGYTTEVKAQIVRFLDKAKRQESTIDNYQSIGTDEDVPF